MSDTRFDPNNADSTDAGSSAEQLVAHALRVRQHAHAPYSEFFVGAALRTRDGRVFGGCNVENASYGLTICAERAAIVSAIASDARDFVALAVAAPGGASMCGACRQVLLEFGHDIEVFLADEAGEWTRTTSAALLPGGFDASALKKKS